MKRVLSLLLVVVMLVAMVACGGAEESKAPESQAPQSQAPQSQAPESQAPEAPADIAWPEKPISVIIPAGAGGDTDLNFRLFAKYLQEELGQTIVVTNIKGISVAFEEFAKAANDGYTAMAYHPGFFCSTLLGTIPYSWEDFETVGIYLIDGQSAWFVGNDAPYQNMTDVIEAAKQAPVSYATEVGSMSHLCALQLMALNPGAQINIVDAGGAADKITALMGGQLDLMFNQYGLVKDYIANGDFRCLGIMAEERSELNPDVPTFKEQGVDMVFDKPFWFFFPADTDEAIVNKTAEAFQAVFANEEFAKEAAETMQTEPSYMTQEESIAYLAEINDLYAELLANMQ